MISKQPQHKPYVAHIAGLIILLCCAGTFDKIWPAYERPEIRYIERREIEYRAKNVGLSTVCVCVCGQAKYADNNMKKKFIKIQFTADARMPLFLLAHFYKNEYLILMCCLNK